MSVTPIQKPLPGERVVGVAPQPAARVSEGNRRLNLFSGRALSASALSAEQDGRSRRIALRAQMLSPGVVAGLEIGLESRDQTDFLNLGSGYGIAASGEDVIVGKLTRVPLRSLPVFAPAALLDGAPDIGSGELAPRRLGPSLGEIISKHFALPKVGVIVIQPVVIDQIEKLDADDPCEEDPSSDPFVDDQLLDACRLVYYAWPAEWLQMPAPGDRWRNRLAYTIFDREASNEPDQVMPWELVGVPVGLVAFDENWNPAFADRYAVLRQGGERRRTTSIAPDSGHQSLWHARVQQFADHLVGLPIETAPPADLATQFRYLPPVGLLPKSALRFQSGATSGSRIAGTGFFPGSYAIDAIPVPLEQLDLVGCASQSLAAFDTFVPDQVTMLVPVPQTWYEPDLLKVDKIDPAFQRAVDQFAHQRALWLKRRTDVRAAYAALVESVSGNAPAFPAIDPDAVEPNEEVAPDQIDLEIDAFKTPENTFGTSGTGPLTVAAETDLKNRLSQMPGVKDELPQLAQPGVGLNQFAELLHAKAEGANDKIDLGFLRVQTDIYRTRQKMLSAESATRLAVSPALAAIAQGASALATKEDLDAFLQKAKTTLTPPSTPPHLTPATPSAPAPSAPAVSGATRMFRVQPSTFLAGEVSGRPMIFARRPLGVEIGAAGFRVPGTPAHPAPAPTPVEPLRAAIALHPASLFTSVVAAPTGSRNDDVTQQRAIVGSGYDLRTVSVVERLHDPPTAEVKQSTTASKFSVISNFKNVGISVGDIDIPGFKDANGQEVRKNFSDINDGVLGELLAGRHDPIPDNPDEAAIFSAGVRAMENTIETLRLMEARVQVYRQAAEMCRAAAATVNAQASQASARLTDIANLLAQSRHDVSVARALMAEEQARLDRINARRDQIVNEQVRFIAYHRPRTTEARRAMPMRSIDPGLATVSIPACMARNLTAPDELRAYVNLMREAPLEWFRHIPILIDKINRLDVLHSLVLDSKLRAGFKVFEAPQPEIQTRPGPLAAHVVNVFSAQRQLVMQRRTAAAQTDLATFAGQTWTESRDSARRMLSLGDLIDLGHHHPEVPRVSAAEIENILKVAACLYSDLCGVLPIVRLNWAERLIQVEGNISLSNLSALPNWSEVPILERKEMQALVDWLFSRINSAVPEAVAHMNDLVRVSILLASHAPVADIVAGDVIHDTSVTVGARIDLSVDLTRVNLGMHVLLYQGNQPVARGVVENLGQGVATARVLTAPAQEILLTRNSKVHFAEPDAFSRNPLTASVRM